MFIQDIRSKIPISYWNYPRMQSVTMTHPHNFSFHVDMSDLLFLCCFLSMPHTSTVHKATFTVYTMTVADYVPDEGIKERCRATPGVRTEIHG